MTEVKFKVFCENHQCKDCGKEINEITFDNMTEEESMSFTDSYGQGGEDKADFCPTCNELGFLSEA